MFSSDAFGPHKFATLRILFARDKRFIMGKLKYSKYYGHLDQDTEQLLCDKLNLI